MGAGCCSGDGPKATKPTMTPEASACQDDCCGPAETEKGGCSSSKVAKVDDCCSPVQAETSGGCSSDKSKANKDCYAPLESEDDCCGSENTKTDDCYSPSHTKSGCCTSEAPGKESCSGLEDEKCPDGEGECCFGGKECEDAGTIVSSDQDTLCCDGEDSKENCDGKFGLLQH